MDTRDQYQQLLQQLPSRKIAEIIATIQHPDMSVRLAMAVIAYLDIQYWERADIPQQDKAVLIEKIQLACQTSMF